MNISNYDIKVISTISLNYYRIFMFYVSILKLFMS